MKIVGFLVSAKKVCWVCHRFVTKLLLNTYYFCHFISGPLYSSIGSFWALFFSFCSKTIIHFFFLAVSGNPDAPHITAIEGDKITLNCDVNFPNGANSPYVVQWWRKVRKLQKNIYYDLDLYILSSFFFKRD